MPPWMRPSVIFGRVKALPVACLLVIAPKNVIYPAPFCCLALSPLCTGGYAKRPHRYWPCRVNCFTTALYKRMLITKTRAKPSAMCSTLLSHQHLCLNVWQMSAPVSVYGRHCNYGIPSVRYCDYHPTDPLEHGHHHDRKPKPGCPQICFLTAMPGAIKMGHKNFRKE